MVYKKRMHTVTLEDIKIVKQNFAGREVPPYNPEGRRNFLALIPDEKAEAMRDDGWKIGRLKPFEEEEVGPCFLPVHVRFDPHPPRIVLMSSHGKTDLEERDMKMLDVLTFSRIDLIVNPYMWDANGNSGVKAYVKTLFLTMEPDELEEKYYDVPYSIHNEEPHDNQED